MFNGGKAAREESRAARTAGRERLAAANEQIRLRLRDEFAISALNAVITRLGGNGSPESFAKEAYRYADAMLEARGK